MSEPLIPGGYIILSRKIIESEIWDKPPLYMKVWIYLLTKAQHKDFKKLKRGQLFTSIPEIQEACSWYVGFRKEKPTKDQIYQIIDWLRKPNEAVHEAEMKATMISTMKATHGLLINIDNYSVYQDSKNYESNNEADDEEETKATREQREPNNINKNVKNVKNDKNNNKKTYIDFVLLTDEEYKKLIEKIGESKTLTMIEQLNNYIGSKGKKYKSHYHTILSWSKKEQVGYSKPQQIDYNKVFAERARGRAPTKELREEVNRLLEDVPDC